MSIPRFLVAALYLAVAIPFVSLQAADTTSYRVTSYIPVLFRDTRWIVSGQAYLTGEADNHHEAPGDPQNAIGSSVHDQDLSGNTEWSKIYVTRAVSWNYGFSLGTSYLSRSSREYTDLVTSAYSNHSWDSLSTSTLTCSPSLYGSCSPYISGDFFVNLSGNVRASFQNTYNSDRAGDFSMIDSTDMTTVINYHRSYRTEGNESYQSYSYSLGAALGWGRVYYGNYAATALYMIDELKSHGQIRTAPGHADLDSLTEMIYQFRSAHVVDSRVRRIEALSAIGSYLRLHGITDMSDVAAALYLQDVWDYFPRDSRPFGFRVQLGVSANDSRNWRASGATLTENYTEIFRPVNNPTPADTTISDATHVTSSHGSTRSNTPSIDASVEYYRPLSLRTQFGASAYGHYFLDPHYSETSYVTSDENHRYNLLGSVGLDYIVNSRTRANASSSLSYSTSQAVRYYAVDYIGDTTWSRQDLTRFTLAASVEYRIAIPTTLSAKLQYDTYRQNDKYTGGDGAPRSTGHYYTLSVSLSHYIY